MTRPVLAFLIHDPANPVAGYRWEVFHTDTGALVASGTASTDLGAEQVAKAVIAAHAVAVLVQAEPAAHDPVEVKRVDTGWAVMHPQVGWVPLPFAPRATFADIVRHVGELPFAAGRRVILRSI